MNREEAGAHRPKRAPQTSEVTDAQLKAAWCELQALRRRGVIRGPVWAMAGPPPGKDRSKPLSMTLTEEQWMLIGGLLAQEIQSLTLPEPLQPAIRKAALEIQQTINRLWRAELPKHLQGAVVNFGGERWVTAEYLFGPEETNN